jgi:hypothetical protein
MLCLCYVALASLLVAVQAQRSEGVLLAALQLKYSCGFGCFELVTALVVSTAAAVADKGVCQPGSAHGAGKVWASTVHMQKDS